MHTNDAARRVILDLDTAGAMRLWPQAFPHLPPIESEAQALVVLHMARTEAQTIPPRLRFYSHRWLLDRGHRSRLPDHLRPRAERMYPRVVDAVAIAVVSRHAEVRQAIQRVTTDAIMDCYANGDTEPAFVKSRWMEARMKERKALLLPPIA